ncbi:MAG: glycosyltransferase [Clostridia bacterium]|nr:glycosyltransferase [Clostridia bacterium]
MGFTEIEKMGKQVFEQFPVIKRTAKRVYQLAGVMTSNEKFKSEGDMIRVSPDDGYEYFYGYYDKPPWDATDRYMIAIKVKQAYKSVAPKEAGVVVLIDTKKDNKVYKIGITHSWNVQQSCMVQWLGPDFKSRIIYNDFRDGKYCSIIYSIKEKKEVKVLPLPIYDVSRDGMIALSIDFNRLHRMRPGYGYSNLPDTSKGKLCPEETCIWKMVLETGEVTDLFKYTDFAEFEPDESMVGAEHKVNHLMISPNGKRFMVLHRWFQKGRKHTRLVTVNIDKTEMYNLSDDVFVSHCYWKNDEEILSFLRKKATGDHYYLMRDRTQEYRIYWPELNTDGHCSYSPDSRYIITDTYPNRKRIATVYLCTEGDNKARKIARVFSRFRYDNNCRCDLHPRWSRSGDKICIDSVHEGKRGLYVIPVPVATEAGKEEKIPRIIHSVWMGGSLKSDVVKKSMQSWKTHCSNYQMIEWSEDNVDLENTCEYVKQAYEKRKWVFVSDYVRLKVLYEHGGIYMDTDMEVLRNIDDFLTYDGFLCTESYNTICTAIIATKPHAEWVKEFLDEYQHISFVKEDGSLDTLPNTKRLQKYLEKKYSYHWSDDVQELENGLVIFPQNYFSPLNCFTGVLNLTDNTYTYHHYDNTWKNNTDKMKKIMQVGTRVIEEDTRAKLCRLKNNWMRIDGGGGYKVVFLVTRLRKSGPVSQTLDLIRYLNKDKYLPIVVSLYTEDKNNTMLPQYREAGAEYLCINIGRMESVINGGKLVANFMKELEPDIIHSVGMPLYRMAIKYKACPNFTTIHNYVYDDYPVKYGKIVGNAMAANDIRLIKRNAKYMVTCSSSLSDIYKSKYGIDVDYIRNGVDVSRYCMVTSDEKLQLREKLNLPREKNIAVFTGQICERKNQKFAVEGILAARRVDICLVLLGGGVDLDTLRERYAKNRNIIFTGEVSNVAEYLNAADLYISSSMSEGLPVSVLEAMASGLPIMLSDIVQHEEVINTASHLGMIFENNDMKSFLNALDKMLTSDLKVMGENCYRVASTTFSAALMTRNYEKEYLNFIKRNRGGA